MSLALHHKVEVSDPALAAVGTKRARLRFRCCFVRTTGAGSNARRRGRQTCGWSGSALGLAPTRRQSNWAAVELGGVLLVDVDRGGLSQGRRRTPAGSNSPACSWSSSSADGWSRN